MTGPIAANWVKLGPGRGHQAGGAKGEPDAAFWVQGSGQD